MERPSFIGHYTQFLEEDNSHYPGSDELLSIGSAVGKKLGLKRIGVHVETLPPGRRTSYPHAESDEEEFGFVLEGNPDVWINGYLHPLSPGDFVAFPPGTGIAHTFINNSNSPVRLLVGGEASKKSNRIIYPLDEAQNLVKKTQETYWACAPKHELGPHNGRPAAPSNLKWNMPVLVTERLCLRPLERSDAPGVFSYAGNPNVSRFVLFETHRSLADSEAFIDLIHKAYLDGVPAAFAVTLRTSPDTFLGTVGAFWNSKKDKVMELGAAIAEEHWGNGYVSEALSVLVDYCWKSFDVERIQSRCKRENHQSRRMMEKMGMNYEGLIRSSVFSKGRSWDMEMFAFYRENKPR